MNTFQKIFVGITIATVISCDRKQTQDTSDIPGPLTEFSNYYRLLKTEALYSQNVSDSFRIFKAVPDGYHKDSAETYPLIVILDANAFFEPTVAELKFNSFIGMIPKAIVVGVGYKDFSTMDSLRSRDYTWPVAIPEYEMPVSGGADKMKKFIDRELLPKLRSEFKIDSRRIALCGHSLGAYFALYYGLSSISEKSFAVTNIVAASPSLHYNNRYLFEMEKAIAKPAGNVPLRIYVSMGSEDMADEESKGILDSFASQVVKSNYAGLTIRKAEYSNFGHIDAALPGFIKGLAFVFEE